ncbi:MAG: thioredoxin domain-containing protein [Proteobacteria bacterium]|nr:thioredoxin domain-containing protein [Pseudomonadota bacterium]
MKRFLLFALAACLALSACSGTGPQPQSDRSPAATINGETITMGELNTASKDQLMRVETQIFQIKKTVLDSLIEEKIIALEAKKKGLSADEFIRQEIEAKVNRPTDEEVKALYDARKGAMKQPFDEVKDQIRDYLVGNRMARARAELLARLRSDANVKVLLSPPRVEVEFAGAPETGSGKITIVEFSDYQCPFSQRVRPTVWKLLEEYDGKIRYVFMDFPLSFHKDAKKAHEAARCAGDQGKYFDFNKKIFDNQSRMSVADMKSLAKDLGLDAGAFGECLESGAHAAEVEKSVAQGMQAGVNGTPTFFINGILLSGAQPYGSFKEIIETELSR